jgi:zinc/manganese transport system substrate-binding protein
VAAVPVRIAVLVAALALVAAGCGSPAAAPGGGLSVVAATDVYGDLARQVAGDRATVTSIIDDPDQDPHSYEADAATQLALSRARIVVENGGGYDDFVGRMLATAGNAGATVLDAVDISGRAATGGGALNEHVWYDLPTVRRLVARLAGALTTADPAGAAGYAANAAALDRRLVALEATAARIRAAHAGTGVAITEPVPLYLLAACGLVNRTPPAFSEAVEEGGDVPARVLAQTLALFPAHRVALLAYNEQTAGPEATRVVDAARAAGVAVVPVTETLPAGQDYPTWMAATLAAVDQALAR